MNIKFELGIFKDLSLDIEKEVKEFKQILGKIKAKINYLSRYFSDLFNLKLSSSNFGLQKKINLLTVITLAFAIISGVASAIEIIKFSFKIMILIY